MTQPAARLMISLLISMVVLLQAPPAGASGGQPVEFNLPSVYGGKLSMNDFRGRVVLLDFFASWCRPCKEGIPKLNKLHKEFGPKGLSVVGFSLDTSLSVVKPFVVRNNVEFPVVMGDKDLAIKLGQVKVLPTTLVIDPQGRVVDRFEGLASEEKLLAAVRPYLSDNAPPAPDAAMVRNRQPNEARITSVYVEDNHELGGARGLAVYVRGEVTDLYTERGLWLRLDLKPTGKGAGAAKSLYQRIDDPTKNRHVLFVRCDQLPAVPADGKLKVSVAIVGPDQKPVEKSEETEVPRPCQYGQGAAPAGGEREPGPSQEGDSTPAWGGGGDGQESQAQPRFQRIWVNEEGEGSKPGLSVHVIAELSDLKAHKVLYMQLNLQPEARSPKGEMTPAGEPKALFVKVDDLTRRNFQIIIRCDQLPKLPEGGAYRAWIAILGDQKQTLEKSGEFLIPGTCQAAPRGR